MIAPRSIVIGEPARTANGTFDGSLKDITAPDLGAARLAPPFTCRPRTGGDWHRGHGPSHSGRCKDERGPAGRCA